MRVFVTLSSMVLVAMFPVLLVSQQQAATETGEKPFGSFDGTSVESVNLENGQLVLNAPLYSLPQRGQLALSFSITYQDLVYALNVKCAPLGGQCNSSLHPNPGTTYGVQIALDQGVKQVTDTDTEISSNLYAEAYALTDMQDTAHNFGYNGSYYQAVDGSGWAFIPQSNGEPPYYPTGNCGIGTPCPLSSGTVIDPSGNYYALSGENANGSISQITDVDGNYLTISSSAITDTLDRTVPFPSAAPNTSISNCPSINAPFQTLASAVQWSLPAYQGTANYIICYASMHVSVSEVAEYSANETVIQSIVRPDGTYWGFVYAAANPNNPSSTGNGDLTQILFPTGGSINYTWEEFTPYCTVPDGIPGSISGQTSLLPDAVATRTVFSNGVNNVWGYAYAETQQYPTTTVTDPIGDQTVHTFSVFSNSKCSLYETNTQYQQLANGNLSTIKTVSTSYQSVVNQDPTALPVAYPTQITTTWPNGQSYSSTNTWDSGVNYLTYWCQPEGLDWSCYVSNEQQVPLGKVISHTNYDYNGNVLSQVQTRFLWQANNNYLTANLLNTPSSVTIVGAGGGEPTSQTLYTYDESAKVRLFPQQSVNTQIGAPRNSIYGHPTQITKVLTSGPSPTSSIYWLNTGEIDHTVDPNNNTTSFIYSTSYDGAYLTQSVNAKGQSNLFSYDFNSGLQIHAIDANSQPTEYSYDAMDRLTHVSYPDGGSVTNTYNPTGYPQNSVVTTILMCNGGSNCSPEESTGQSSSTLEVYDGLGRPIEKAMLSDPSGQPDYITMTYDPLDRLASISNPYRTMSDSTYGVTSYQYDMLNRETSLTRSADGSSQAWTYSGATTTAFDEENNATQRTTDALGRLVEVVEPGGLTTQYSYDPLNNLLTVSQLGISGTDTPRLRNFTYDSLSRLLSATNPENGATTYTYDADGNVLSKTDARNITIDFEYDALNRLTWKFYYQGNNQIASPVGFGFDGKDELGNAMNPAPTNSIGRLTHASNEVNAAENFSYDPMGRVAEEAYCTPSNCSYTNTVQASYDLAGNLTSLTYPDGRVVTQSFDGAGHLQQAQFQSWNGIGIGYPYLTSAQYSPNGTLMAAAYGSGAAEAFVENNRLQLKSMSFTGAQAGLQGQLLMSKQFCYIPACGAGSTNNGDIYQITDGLNEGDTQNFGYDSLNSLISFSQTNGSIAQTYSIDSFGNVDQTSPGTWQNNLSFAANNQISSSGYGYDAAGNLTTIPNPAGGTEQIVFDPEDRITNYNDNAAIYTYDAFEDRVRKYIAGNNWTEYLFFDGQPITELNSDGTWSDYIFANGTRIARSDSFDERIHIEGTSNTAGSYAAWYLPFSQYVIQSGDKISWRQFQNGAVGGPGFSFTDGTSTNWTTYDTDGQVMNSDNTEDSWHFRTVDLTPCAGKTVVNLWITADAGTPAGSWFSYFADIAIYSSNGSVTPIYYRQPSIGLSYFYGGSESNTQAFVERGNTVADAESPWNTTTFYSADQIGSARMLSSGGGWPVSTDTFYPYGQEFYTPADNNHYKFTGKERDQESGIDYFGARYYASTMGRFLSPDPGWFGATDPENPQTWNLYTYALNNPLAIIDPDGYDCVYLNNAGTDVDRDANGNITGIDTNSNSGECGKNGGYWVDGTVTNVDLFTNSNDVGLTGYTTDANGNKTDTSASYTNADAPENRWLVDDLGFPSTHGVVDMIGLANYRQLHPLAYWTAPSTSEIVTGCVASGVGHLALDLSPVGILPDMADALQNGSTDPLFNSGDRLNDAGNAVDVAEKSADALKKVLPFAGPVAKKLGPLGVSLSIAKGLRDTTHCIKQR